MNIAPPPPAHPDAVYIEALLTGNPSKKLDIYKKFFPAVKRYVLNNSGDEEAAHDVFQDALVAIWEKAKERGSSFLTVPLGAYLYVVVGNLWKKELRSKTKIDGKGVINDEILEYIGVSVEEVASAEALLIADALENDKAFIIKKCFDKLGASCQDLLGLWMQGKSYKEISDAREQSVTYIGKALSNCKNRLRELMMPYEVRLF